MLNPRLKLEHVEAMLRILVVSEVRLFQEGVSSVLARQPGVSVIGTADAASARARAEELSPDVVLFDAARRESIEQARQFVALLPTTKIVAFGVPEANDEILALAAAGTAGYVCADAEANDVVDVLDRVMRDELLCSPQAAASLYRQVAVLSHDGNSQDCNGTADSPLSRRELQIAHLIDRGLSNKQIAHELGIEATTVKNHLHHIFDKLKVHRRGEAAAWIRANFRSLATSLAGAWKTPRSGRKGR